MSSSKIICSRLLFFRSTFSSRKIKIQVQGYLKRIIRKERKIKVRNCFHINNLYLFDYVFGFEYLIQNSTYVKGLPFCLVSLSTTFLWYSSLSLYRICQETRDERAIHPNSRNIGVLKINEGNNLQVNVSCLNWVLSVGSKFFILLSFTQILFSSYLFTYCSPPRTQPRLPAGSTCWIL